MLRPIYSYPSYINCRVDSYVDFSNLLSNEPGFKIDLVALKLCSLRRPYTFLKNIDGPRKRTSIGMISVDPQILKIKTNFLNILLLNNIQTIIIFFKKFEE